MTRKRACGWAGGVRLVAVALALVVRILVPPGYMPSSGSAFTLAICTGQGMRTMQMKAPAPDGAPADRHGGARPCAFADDGPCPPLMVTSGVVPPPADYGLRLAALPCDPTPGRGLAAPPPPSRGPPALLA